MSSKNEQLSHFCQRAKTWIAASDIDSSAFEELALDLFRFQFEHNLPYQRLCRATGRLPSTVASLDHIPAVVTSAFKEADWTLLDPAARTAVFLSSGTTTQQRGRHHHSAETLAVYETALLRWFKPFVLPDLDRAEFMLLSPPPSEAPNSSLVHMFAAVTCAFGKGAFYASARHDGAWHLDFERIAHAPPQGPVVLCGTAFSFVHLCDWIAETGSMLRFPEGSRVFETGGYKGRSRTVSKPELHALISRSLGLPQTHIISEYGMSELSSQAYDRICGADQPRLFRFPPWARAQIIDPESGREAPAGKPGLIRVCDLANIASVMAIQTEDLGVRRGQAFELLGRAAQVEPRGCSLLPA